MAVENLIQLYIKKVPDISRLRWAEGMRFSLPDALVKNSNLIEHLDSEGKLELPTGFETVSPQDAEAFRLLAAFTEKKPLSSRLPIPYQTIPPRLRSFVACHLGKYKRRKENRWARFPKWPLDLSADFLTDLCTGKSSPFAEKPTPVLLTHDIDSAEGLGNLVQCFLDLEESVGARSTNFIVPCAWEIDHCLLEEVKTRGNDVGIHGYDHNNLTAFSKLHARRQRIRAGAQFNDRYGIIGYRSPSLLRTPDLLRDLTKFYRFDSSIPTSGGLFPVPNNGCASARPFPIEGLHEIPISLPRDGSLIFLGYSPNQILTTWIHCAEQISRSGGVIVLLTHCERRFSGNLGMLNTYRKFLDFIAASNRFEWSHPRKILSALQ